MSDFIKKNMPLMVVLGVTAVAAAILIVLVVIHYKTINEKMLNIDTINSNINAITSQANPRIVTENARLINEDAAELQQKTKEQQRVLGCYHDPAIQVFINTLQKEAVSADFKAAVKDMTRESLAAILAKHVEGFNLENPDAEEVKKIYQAVKDEILASADEKDQEAFTKAFDAFIAAASSVTLENLKAEKDKFAVKEAVFLQALGLPRSFKNVEFETYFVTYAEDLVRNKKIPFENEADNNINQIKLLFTAGKLTVSADGEEESTVQLDQIQDFNLPYIMARIQIYENLIMNMSASGLKLVTLHRANDYKPDVVEENEPYVRYSTVVKVRGSLKQIRQFANLLHKEYLNNRVYRVTYMSLSSDDPDKKEKAGRKQKDYSGEVTQALAYADMQRVELGLDVAAEAEGGESKREKNKVYLDSIGAPLLGINDRVYAVFHIEYIVFTGDQITNAKK